MPIKQLDASTKQSDTPTKQFDTSIKHYNLRYWKATRKLLPARINKILQLIMILRTNKRHWENMKINERHWMFMFVSMNAVNYSGLQPWYEHTQRKKQPSFRQEKCWIRSIMRQRNYLQRTVACNIVSIVVTSHQKDVMHIRRNRVLHISIMLRKFQPRVIV